MVNPIYTAATYVVQGAVHLYGHCLASSDPVHKFLRFVRGRRHLFQHIRQSMQADSQKGDTRPVVWIHAASLGEYGIARPIIERIKEEYPCRVVLTFFSPSGYDAVTRQKHAADHIFYLPIDTPANARRFLTAINPSVALFMVSEYWPNMLSKLRHTGIPTYLVSALIRRQSPFFKWYGRTYRRALRTYTQIFALDAESIFNLNTLGYEEASLSGDPLFDNALAVANTPWCDDVISHFTKDRPTLIAGSIDLTHDTPLIAAIRQSNPSLPILLVPHETDTDTVSTLQHAFPNATLYSKCKIDPTAAATTNEIIIDHVGSLAYLYRYGTWAYVGGGFTPLLHSVIEPVVYGLPVAFGPLSNRKITPKQLIELGIGTQVRTTADAQQWIKSQLETLDKIPEVKHKCTSYVERNTGATQALLQAIAPAIHQ